MNTLVLLSLIINHISQSPGQKEILNSSCFFAMMRYCHHKYCHMLVVIAANISAQAAKKQWGVEFVFNVEYTLHHGGMLWMKKFLEVQSLGSRTLAYALNCTFLCRIVIYWTTFRKSVICCASKTDKKQSATFIQVGWHHPFVSLLYRCYGSWWPQLLLHTATYLSRHFSIIEKKFDFPYCAPM